MALIVCRSCKRAFISSPQEEDVCPDCTARLRELYPIVRNFLRDHEKEAYTAHDVSRLLDIDIQSVEGLVALGLIDTAAGIRSGADAQKSDPSKPLKIRPMDAQESQALLDKTKSSMHTYRKKQEKDS